MERHFSKHTHHNSPIESDDNCGTCDGANCDTCKLYYTVSGVNVVFYDVEDATKAEENISTLIPSINHIDYSKLFERDGKLYYTAWKYEQGCANILCNEESPLYASKLEEVRHKMQHYDECKCVDKDGADDGDCRKYGCDDSSCYREMKSGRRTEKKWYM